ncbi:bifunctional 2-methylcitrate dehydratase/aconitate hydratase [Jeongeupia naejangsanensis]|uniref:2-methylcitrate dehydratase n=1 Tax=Jeongeupia naejangsanensis TaxID=613195 RepID=A0ABS2BIY9_9NEIS|nr:bifunctional 2-methylcitrate dehydratase/aconitate hydratase [Jeongeupia naejangsanensis]MBM3115561.1 bifunctional 2-methylcitrate dehydratase/aconitate hydratase [Jeongeupia naejangsanensis]
MTLPSSHADAILQTIADYVCQPFEPSEEAIATARLCLLDSIGCAVAALDHPACTRLLGPTLPGTRVPKGARVIGSGELLDPVKAAFDATTLIRWLDYNDTWLAAEWAHPSDNLGALLAIADWRCRNGHVVTLGQLLNAMIQSYEIQGVLALGNAFNRVGLDHVLLVKVASCAVVMRMLGGSRDDVINAVSHAWLDGTPLRVYRHAPNAGPRKSWAAGDAASRAVWLALLTHKGELGYPTSITTPIWGFQDTLFRGQSVVLAQPLGSYVMEHILFKVAHPAEFHGQTAVEAAIELHPQLIGRFDCIDHIDISTTEAALRIIARDGPLTNPAARDHCLQYMTAVALLRGNLTAADYEDDVGNDPRIERLRARISTAEHPQWSRDYLDPQRRSIANGIRIRFNDGSPDIAATVEFPLGHRLRRAEARPHLIDKFVRNSAQHLGAARQQALVEQILDPNNSTSPVSELVDQTVG